MHITDQLDPNLDWSTYEITGIHIGEVNVPVSDGSQTLSTTVPAVVPLKDWTDPDYPNVPPADTNVNIEVNCEFDPTTGLAQWHFVGRDPVTGELADFLPPNVWEDDPATTWDDIVAPHGEGWVSYACKPKDDLPSGTRIENTASIVFDVNEPMETNLVFNTIDAGTPTSQVEPLPAQTPESFEVQWSGADEENGAGIAGYDIYVSDDGAPYERWLTATTDTSGTYTGNHGHVYRFFSVATDGVGHREAWPDEADGETTVVANSTVLPNAGYYMISFPMTAASGTVHDLLCDDLGDAPGTYYMWRWNASSYDQIPTTPPGCQASMLSTREGYWVLAPAATLDIDGTMPTGDQTISLQTGWNIIAAPFPAGMDSLQVDNAADVRPLADAQAANWVLATFYDSYDGTGAYETVTIGQTPPDALSVWHGYWVLAAVDCWLTIPAPLGATMSEAPAGAGPEPAWSFDIRARSGDSVDSIRIAAADGASDGFDGFAWDKPKPPAAPGEGRVRMVLREGWRGTEPPPYNKAPGRQMPWASELATETKGTAQEDTEWQLTVTGGVQGESVTLTWPDLSQLPKDRVAVLTDRDAGKRSFMRSRARYEFAAPGESSSRSFTVTVRPAHEGALLISGLTAAPARGGTWDIGFNLSADAAVTGRVYNVAGRRVADIAQAQQFARGRASLVWDSRSIANTHVPSGVYLLRVTARTEEGEQASAVTMLQVRR